jgi:hypothetical protein
VLRRCICGRVEMPRRSRGSVAGMGGVVFARFRVMPEGRPRARLPVIHSPRNRGMVIYDRDRTGSIKRATTPPAVGGQTQNDPRPVTSEPAHAAVVVCSRARMRPSRRP